MRGDCMFGVLAAKTDNCIDVLKCGKVVELNNLLPQVRKVMSDKVTLKVIEMSQEDIELMLTKQDLIQSMLEGYFE